MAAAAAEKDEPKKAQRTTSNVFAFFNQTQIQELKEVGDALHDECFLVVFL